MYTLKNYRELLNLCLRANGYGAERSDMTFEAPPSNNHFKELIELVGLSDKEAQEELLDILISVDRERLSEFLQNGNGRNIFPEIKTKLRELIDGRGNILEETRTFCLELQGQISPAPNTTEEYTIVRGDSLTKIARRYNITVDDLINLQEDNLRARFNKNRNLISIGEKLKVPTSTSADRTPQIPVTKTTSGTPIISKGPNNDDPAVKRAAEIGHRIGKDIRLNYLLIQEVILPQIEEQTKLPIKLEVEGKEIKFDIINGKFILKRDSETREFGVRLKVVKRDDKNRRNMESVRDSFESVSFENGSEDGGILLNFKNSGSIKMKRNALAGFVADSLKRPTNNSTLISLDRGKLYLGIEEQH